MVQSIPSSHSLTNKERMNIIKHVKKQGGVLVVSYEGLRIDKVLLHSNYWHYCILDEAQKIKNHKSLAYEAAI